MQRKRSTHVLDELARHNFRVFTLRELLDLGFSPQQIRTMEARGQLHQRYRGVYVYGHPDLGWQGAYLAAQRVGGDGAYLTWGSGLAANRLWRPYLGRIHVTTLSRHRSRDNMAFHQTRTPPQPDELKSDGPLRFARVPRLLLEFAPESDDKQLKRLITKAVQQDKLDHALTRTVLARYPRHPGNGPLTAAYSGYLVVPRSKSELEAEWNVQFARRPWLPEPLKNQYVEAGGITWEIDRFWPDHNLGVEIDGRNYHQALADRDKDELKRAKLLTIGIQTLSISDWRMEYSIQDCLDDLEAVLALSTRRAA